MSLSVGTAKDSGARGGVAIVGEPERRDPTDIQLEIWGRDLELHGCQSQSAGNSEGLSVRPALVAIAKF